jgi:hypothetical protein
MAAPILVFAFNRPMHLQRTLEALAENSPARESDVIVFSDGPRKDEDIPQIQAVRDVVRKAEGFASIRMVERVKNWGLAGNILSGVGEALEKYSRIIVLEDDLITSPFFLRFMNDALDLYENEPNVGNIHGWCFPSSEPLPETFFLPGGGCLGWATWRDSWNCLEWNPLVLHKELKQKKLLKRFNRMGNYDFSTLLPDMGNWATRRYASMMCLGQLTLTPGRSLVQHEGDDGSGTNCGVSDAGTVMTDRHIHVVPQHPPMVDPRVERLWNRYFGSVTGGHTLRKRIVSAMPDPVALFLRNMKKKLKG